MIRRALAFLRDALWWLPVILVVLVMAWIAYRLRAPQGP